jgi:hypothetical protein
MQVLPYQPVNTDEWEKYCVPVGEQANLESGAVQQVAELAFAVAPVMLERVVVRREEPLMGRNTDDYSATRP